MRTMSLVNKSITNDIVLIIAKVVGEVLFNKNKYTLPTTLESRW